ncbi:MAG: hypothetical protein GC192_12145 [Bacteroidetes bacterium]|nr:hypothetical protein [Bacteroidota bacterium]
MKNIIIPSILLLLFFLSSCKKDDDLKVSDCMEKTITDFQKDPSTCPTGATVKEYEFQGQKVYAFDLGSCVEDAAVTILSSECDILCEVGGFGGTSDCLGFNFFENAKELRVVWKN